MNTCILIFDVKVEGEALRVGALADSVQDVFEMEKEQFYLRPI